MPRSIPETSDLSGFKTFEEFLNHSLAKTIVDENADILIIDNLTYLRDETENARNALPLMKYLKELKSRHGISILALAHTPKRDSSKPLGRNDLQGSKMLINFCDSSFAIGESAKDVGLKYLKQIKARNTAIIYNADNVLLCSIAKNGSLLQFDFLGTATEAEHLRTTSEKDKDALIAKVQDAAASGKTQRQIAEALGISQMTVSRYLKLNQPETGEP
ncbi:MAG: helix-turn-helix domain-containing protein [Pyrinomonadaceae bacterium]